MLCFYSVLNLTDSRFTALKNKFQIVIVLRVRITLFDKTTEIHMSVYNRMQIFTSEILIVYNSEYKN